MILSDINMPGMTGLQRLQQIKQKYQALPLLVMIIIAYGDAENHHAMQLGAEVFLAKLLDFIVLKEKLQLKN